MAQRAASTRETAKGRTRVAGIIDKRGGKVEERSKRDLGEVRAQSETCCSPRSIRSTSQEQER